MPEHLAPREGRDEDLPLGVGSPPPPHGPRQREGADEAEGEVASIHASTRTTTPLDG